MAKKKGYEAWEEEQQQIQSGAKQAPAVSVVRNTNTVKYSQPNYRGNSVDSKKTYAWEKNYLSQLPVKRYGRSYNDKFNTWAKEQGIQDNELNDFRNWLDSQEDGVDDASAFMDDLLRTKNQRDRSRMEQNRGKQVQRFNYNDPVKAEVQRERDGFLGFLDRTIGRTSRAAQEAVFGEEFVNEQDENYRRNKYNVPTQQMLNTTSREAEGILEKGADIAGSIIGETAAYVPAYGVAGKLVKGGSIAKELGRGAIAGGLVGTSRAIEGEMSNPDEFGVGDWAKTIGIEAALAGGGDAAVSAVLRNLNLKSQLSRLLQDQGMVTPTEAEMETVLKQTFGQQGNPTNVLAPTPTPEVPRVDDFLSSLQPRAVQSTNEVVAPDIRQQEVEGILNEQQNVFQQRQVEEDAFVQERLAPFNEMQERSAQADVAWQSTKQAKSEADRIKKNYGKIIIPEGNQADWGKAIPPQFKAGKAETKGIDIYKFADEEGFSSVDEAVEYLQGLDAEARTKLKDLKPVDNMNITPDQMAELEEAARREFGNTPTGQGLDKLFDDLVRAQKDVETPPEVKLQQWLEEINPNQASNEAASTVQAQDVSNPGEPVGILPKAVDDGSPIANTSRLNKLLEGIRGGKTSLGDDAQKFKEDFISDTQVAKDVMKDLAKMDTEGKLTRNPTKKQNDVSYADNWYKKLRATRRSNAVASEIVKSDLKPLLDKAKDFKISRTDLEEYALAKRVQDVWAFDPDYKFVKDEKWVNDTISKWENNPNMNELQQDLVRYHRATLDMRQQAGLYNADEVAAMTSKSPNYVPLAKDMEELELLSGKSGNITKAKRDLRQLGEGSEDLKILSPIDTAIRSTYLSVENAQKNLANQTIEKLTEVKGADKYFRLKNPNEGTGQYDISFFKDGKRQTYEVAPAIKRMVDTLDTKQAETRLKAIEQANNLIRKGATQYNLNFIFNSILRDPQSALMSSRTGAGLTEWGAAWLDTVLGKNLEKVTKGKMKSYKDVYREKGGEYSGFITMDNSSLNKVSKSMEKGTLSNGAKIINPFTYIEKFGSSVEHVSKLAEYRSAKKKGYSDDDAMFEAVDIMDYSDAGATTRSWNRMITFLNASVRGNTRLVQAFKENPAKFTAKGAAYITLPTVGAYAMRYHPDVTDEQRSKIDNAQDWEKNMYWFVPIPNSKDNTVLSLPKAHVLAQVFANPFERALDKVMEDKNVDAKQLGTDLLNSLKPPMGMAGVMTLIELWANKDFFYDAPIVPDGLVEQANENQVDDKTSAVSEGLADRIGASPMKVDHLIKSLTGGVGQQVLDSADKVLRDTPRAAKSDNDLFNFLAMRTPYVKDDTRSSGKSSDVYEVLNELSSIHDSARGNEKAKLQEQGMSEDSISSKLRGWKSNASADKKNVEGITDQLKVFREEIKSINSDKSMTPQEKRSTIEGIRQQERKFLDGIDLDSLKNVPKELKSSK